MAAVPAHQRSEGAPGWQRQEARTQHGVVWNTQLRKGKLPILQIWLCLHFHFWTCSSVSSFLMHMYFHKIFYNVSDFLEGNVSWKLVSFTPGWSCCSSYSHRCFCLCTERRTLRICRSANTHIGHLTGQVSTFLTEIFIIFCWSHKVPVKIHCSLL